MEQLRTATELARALRVEPAQVWVWYSRRATNGFPDPWGRAVRRTRAGRARESTVWDLGAVRRWRKAYVPRRYRPKVTV